jgi:Domain of unknown function (DUF4397)
MQHSRFAVFGVLALALAGCREDGSDPVLASVPPVAYVRYINAVPDTNNTLVRWVDRVEFVPQTFVNVAYRGLGQGNYQGVDVRAKHIRIFTADFVNFTEAINTVVLLDTNITFEAGKYYTLLHSGYARAGSLPKQALKVIEDVHPTPGANVATRYINALVAGNVDLYQVATATTAPSGTPTVANLAIGGVSAYTTRAPATATFATAGTAPGTTTPLFTVAAPAGTLGNPFAPAANGIPAVQPVDPISGGTVPGSVMTAVAFPRSVAGSPAASFTTPGLVYFLDKQPPRFTTP